MKRAARRSIEIVGDCDALEDEWWSLWSRDSAATPFQSPAWLLPWRQQFGGSESFILTLRRGGRLAALVPLFRNEGRLLLWGAGTSDWLDGVFDPALQPEELSPLFAEIGEPLDFFQLRAASPLRLLPLPAGWTERSAPAEPCVGMELPSKPGASMARNLRYCRRRATRSDISEPQRAGASSFDELADLHRRRWNQREQPGVLEDAKVLAWHHGAAPRLERAGLLRLYLLKSGSRTVAALYVLAAKQRAFYYIGGFDPEFAALGLGTVLVGHAIAEAEREGFASFDFLRGGEAYKYRWGGSDQPTYARSLQPAAGRVAGEPGATQSLSRISGF